MWELKLLLCTYIFINYNVENNGIMYNRNLIDISTKHYKTSNLF